MPNKQLDFVQLAKAIKCWGQALGFQQVGITDTDLSIYRKRYYAWLAKHYHGDMAYMARNIEKRCYPQQLLGQTKCVISVRMNYLPPQTKSALLKNPVYAFISRYALGRDYHKLMRKRLQQLANNISAVVGNFGYRAFTDSAPVLEKPLAEKAGLGWIGKHTNLINKKAGSWFFLGELYTDLPLPLDHKAKNHCGSCSACLAVCPTQAIVAPYQLDARRCISYLTIELKTAIPKALRPLMGNRIYGCDDCQLVCPWNKFATPTTEEGFYARRGLSTAELISVFNWSEQEFLQKTQGSAISRLGYQRWLRNVAVALGNAPYDDKVVVALKSRLTFPNPLVQEHVTWALQRQQHFYSGTATPPHRKKLSLIKRWPC